MAVGKGVREKDEGGKGGCEKEERWLPRVRRRLCLLMLFEMISIVGLHGDRGKRRAKVDGNDDDVNKRGIEALYIHGEDASWFLMSPANHMQDLTYMTHLGKGGEDRKRMKGFERLSHVIRGA